MAEISMIRGDTLRLILTDIKNDGVDYTLTDTDIVYLDVRRRANDTTAVIRKTATAADYLDNGLPFNFLPEDTKNLSVGEYVFDVRLVVDDENIFTIIPESKFIIKQNITKIPEGGG